MGFLAEETPPEAGPEPQIVPLANLGIRLKSYPRAGRERVECKLKNTDTATLLIHCPPGDLSWVLLRLFLYCLVLILANSPYSFIPCLLSLLPGMKADSLKIQDNLHL